jgi:hypothetical protein
MREAIGTALRRCRGSSPTDLIAEANPALQSPLAQSCIGRPRERRLIERKQVQGRARISTRAPGGENRRMGWAAGGFHR